MFSEGIGIAVFNEDSFTPGFRGLKTVHASYEDLERRVCSDLVRLENKDAYTAYQKEQYDVCKKYYNYAEYLGRLERFYQAWLEVLRLHSRMGEG